MADYTSVALPFRLKFDPALPGLASASTATLPSDLDLFGQIYASEAKSPVPERFFCYIMSSENVTGSFVKRPSLSPFGFFLCIHR